jgi:hypothetical protein
VERAAQLPVAKTRIGTKRLGISATVESHYHYNYEAQGKLDMGFNF